MEPTAEQNRPTPAVWIRTRRIYALCNVHYLLLKPLANSFDKSMRFVNGAGGPSQVDGGPSQVDGGPSQMDGSSPSKATGSFGRYTSAFVLTGDTFEDDPSESH